MDLKKYECLYKFYASNLRDRPLFEIIVAEFKRRALAHLISAKN